MTIKRIYYSDDIQLATPITFNKETSHRLLHVLRCKLQDTLHVFNGRGGEYQVTIQSLQKNAVTVCPERYFDIERESPLEIHVGQGLSRGERMDYAIQKMVELGVQNITPVIMEHCSVALSDARMEKRLQHWRAVALSACEQSGRTRLPEIHTPKTLEAWVEARTETTLFCQPGAPMGLSEYSIKKGCRVGILIGPEGGLSASECQVAEAAACLPLRMGPRILRTETAAVVAVTLLQSRLGDF